jgi:hypothetical protein
MESQPTLLVVRTNLVGSSDLNAYRFGTSSKIIDNKSQVFER